MASHHTQARTVMRAAFRHLVPTFAENATPVNNEMPRYALQLSHPWAMADGGHGGRHGFAAEDTRGPQIDEILGLFSCL